MTDDAARLKPGPSRHAAVLWTGLALGFTALTCRVVFLVSYPGLRLGRTCIYAPTLRRTVWLEERVHQHYTETLRMEVTASPEWLYAARAPGVPLQQRGSPDEVSYWLTRDIRSDDRTLTAVAHRLEAATGPVSRWGIRLSQVCGFYVVTRE